MSEELLRVKDLEVVYKTTAETVHAVNKNPAPQECDIYENIHENVHYTAMVSVVDKKQLRIVKATYVVVGIHTKQKLFDLMNLAHVTVNKDGTGLLGRKHEAVFYPKNAVPFKLIGTGNSFMVMVQNCAAYANATLEYI